MLQLFPTVREVAEPQRIYDRLDFPAGRGDRPYVFLNMVSTVDGKTTLDRGRIRDPIGSRLDRVLLQRLRVNADAVLIGAGTARASRSVPVVPADLADRRRREGHAPQPLLVVVTGSGDLPLDHPLFAPTSRQPVLFTSRRLQPGRQEALSARARLHALGEAEVDLAAALRLLRQEYGVERLLTEGGPTLNYFLFRDGLLDELFWTVSPQVAGAAGDHTLVDGPQLLSPRPRLSLLSAYLEASELFLRYRVLHGEGDP